MRQMIKGLIAAVAMMATAPAMACGFNPCGTPVYAAPAVTYNYGYTGYGYSGYGYPSYGYSGCGSCGGWGVERLADPDQYYQSPVQQYYYANQGPTYTGPGDWAPRPVYREGYARPYYGYRHYAYGYRNSGYRHRSYGYRHHYRPSYHRMQYGYRSGYAPHRYGHRVQRRYY